MNDNLRLNSIDSRLTSMEGTVAAMNTSVQSIQGSVSKINGGVTTLKWVLGLLGTGLIAIALYSGKSVVSEIAREVVRQELAYRQTAVQFGKFSDETRTSGNTFQWKLQTPVDSSKLMYLAAEPIAPLPGVSVSAQLADGGRTCVMELKGSDEALASVTYPIEVKLTVSEHQ